VVKLFFKPEIPYAARLSGLPLSKVRSEGRQPRSPVQQALILRCEYYQEAAQPGGFFFADGNKKHLTLKAVQHKVFLLLKHATGRWL